MHILGKNVGLYSIGVRRNQLHWCIWDKRTVFDKAGEIKRYKKELLRLKRVHEYANQLIKNLLCSPTTEGWETLHFKRRKPWAVPSHFSSLPIISPLQEAGQKRKGDRKVSEQSTTLTVCCTNIVSYIKCSIYSTSETLLWSIIFCHFLKS